jgi:glucosamine-phosphate N-acetyltransferase
METEPYIRLVEEGDFERGFIETLEFLSDVSLTPDEARVIWIERMQAGIHTVVAEIDDRVVGTASLIVEKKFIHSGGLVGHIEDVAVHADFQRRGIGTQLVEHLTYLGAEIGCYKVILNALEHVVPFYARLGYRQHDAGLRVNCVELPVRESSMAGSSFG